MEMGAFIQSSLDFSPGPLCTSSSLGRQMLTSCRLLKGWMVGQWSPLLLCPPRAIPDNHGMAVLLWHWTMMTMKMTRSLKRAKTICKEEAPGAAHCCRAKWHQSVRTAYLEERSSCGGRRRRERFFIGQRLSMWHCMIRIILTYTLPFGFPLGLGSLWYLTQVQPAERNSWFYSLVSKVRQWWSSQTPPMSLLHNPVPFLLQGMTLLLFSTVTRLSGRPTCHLIPLWITPHRFKLFVQFNFWTSAQFTHPSLVLPMFTEETRPYSSDKISCRNIFLKTTSLLMNQESQTSHHTYGFTVS